MVGNKNKFDEQGIVPVNSTTFDLNHRKWEKGWLTTEVIAIASGIAGLFHDFGKANDLFQDKLDPNTQPEILHLKVILSSFSECLGVSRRLVVFSWGLYHKLLRYLPLLIGT